MAETTYKQWLAKKKKTELIDLTYQLHLEVIELQEVCRNIKEVLLE